MSRRLVRLAAAVLAMLGLVGCASTSGYNPSYLAAARRPSTVQSDGKVLVVTTAHADAQVYSGHPTSLARRATTLTMPLGSIVRETAIAAFADTFKGGADVSTEVTDPARYVVIVAPRLIGFSYEYNQLKHAGLAMTPTAVVNVDVRVLDASGATRWQRRYASGPVEGPSSMLDTSPGEAIGKLTHKALYDLFSKAAVEVVREVLAVPSAAPAG
jgi:hypothetical protein